LLDLANGKTLVIHLGMSGRVLVTEPDQPITLEKHDHFVLKFESGRHMIYTDARRFGMIFSHDTQTLNDHKLFTNIGPEPLSNHFNSDFLFKALQKRKSNIKAALLDQKLVAGIGNIYASEALYEAGIHPQRISNTITQDECASLYRSVCDVLSRAIDAGGSSLKDYKHADGNMGYFQHNFAVYGREDEQCRANCACGGKGRVQKIVQSGRSTYFCATKQV
jgi:formamidopyrimidine-DNA glycosylase